MKCRTRGARRPGGAGWRAADVRAATPLGGRWGTSQRQILSARKQPLHWQSQIIGKHSLLEKVEKEEKGNEKQIGKIETNSKMKNLKSSHITCNENYLNPPIKKVIVRVD